MPFFRRKLLKIMIATLTPGESLVPGSAFDFMPRLKQKRSLKAKPNSKAAWTKYLLRRC
jgi:hypothetical protein